VPETYVSMKRQNPVFFLKQMGGVNGPHFLPEFSESKLLGPCCVHER